MSEHIYQGIAIAALVTALIKCLPILLFAHRPFPILVKNWLNFIPPAILSAIIAAEVLAQPQTNSLDIPIALSATVLAFIAAFISRSLFITVFISIVGFLVLQNL